MKKKILILGGGISKERLVSLETAQCVYKELKKKNYTAIICEPDADLIHKIKKFKPDIIFNALHGQFGEDGYIQTILEFQKIKYTHSGVIASSIAMDKEISKKIFLKKNKKNSTRLQQDVYLQKTNRIKLTRSKILKLLPSYLYRVSISSVDNKIYSRYLNSYSNFLHSKADLNKSNYLQSFNI
jgi:D-alanine-D-alanine ligase